MNENAKIIPYRKHGYFTSNSHLSTPNGYTVMDNLGNPVADVPSCFAGNGDKTNEHAALIAEAFNVLHETGMTPRQLADKLKRTEAGEKMQQGFARRRLAGESEAYDQIDTLTKQRDDLLAALEFVTDCLDAANKGQEYCNGDLFVEQAKEAIAAAKGGAK